MRCQLSQFPVILPVTKSLKHREDQRHNLQKITGQVREDFDKALAAWLAEKPRFKIPATNVAVGVAAAAPSSGSKDSDGQQGP